MNTIRRLESKAPSGFQLEKYNVSNSTGVEIQVCYLRNVSTDSTLWQIDNPLDQHLPDLVMQLCLIILFTRIVMFLLQPLRQPRFVSELIAGILTGPTFFGSLPIAGFVFKFELNMVVEIYTFMGLTYYMFLVGLEMDLSALKHIGKKSLSIAVAGILFPVIAGAALYFVPLHKGKDAGSPPLIGAVFWATILSNTSFPDLARLLSNVKLLHTELGRLALTVALVSDITTFGLLVATITMFDLNRFYMAVIPTIIFLICCWFLLRPGIHWIIRHSKVKGENKFSETHISFILVGVAIIGCIADACGSHSMFGAFIFGLIIPHGDLALQIMERIEVFVNRIMLPAAFMMNGLRTTFGDLAYRTRLLSVGLVTVCATSAKIISTVFVSSFFGMTSKEGLGLGVLLNTKGVLSMIVLTEARNMKALDNVYVLVMTISILFMTSIVPPIFYFVKKTTKRFTNYKQRTIERRNQDTELRILTCVHSTRNVSGIINLLQLSHATRKSPICVFAMHLVELTGTGRTSAMLIVHDTTKNNNASNNRNLPRERVESEHIISAFRNFNSVNDAVTVYPLTAVSPYDTMHEDIFQLAEDRHVAFILLPYHKLPTSDGRLQGDNLSIQEVNQNLLKNSPCSVGILVDRGLALSVLSDSTFNEKLEFRIAVLFVGGPDDHEALSYATRMAKTRGVHLTVVRFLLGKDAEIDNLGNEENIEYRNENLSESIMNEEGKEFDDEFINEFRFKTMCDQHINYQEKIVNSGEDVLESLRSKYNDFDLYIVGRGYGINSPITMGLTEWSENPELGTVGETLVMTQAVSHASVLVLQQSATGRFNTRLQRRKDKYGQNKWASPILNPDYKEFVSGESVK
ncbi:hypothetical protein Patl1_30624 [Pistacia atlantica]|uniref:Uncharacterized protein n=1 Tax=Pistacia atlantica TaxID=434234 RepID=A0ACC1AFV6_9ROSI|nr:hypothetical protein Patl1_30624 [Pistacia atlantica]